MMWRHAFSVVSLCVGCLSLFKAYQQTKTKSTDCQHCGWANTALWRQIQHCTARSFDPPTRCTIYSAVHSPAQSTVHSPAFTLTPRSQAILRCALVGVLRPVRVSQSQLAVDAVQSRSAEDVPDRTKRLVLQVQGIQKKNGLSINEVK